MPYINAKLPDYPVHSDVWQTLKMTDKPILVYGMGNGADKLFSRFLEYGIEVADIFASDGFVRGHSYRGMRVKSFSEVRQIYSDFVIVLSFATRQPEMLGLLSQIDSEYELYIPDMPVAGTDEYFDKDFYNKNYEKIVEVYNRLADEDSKNAYASIINYKLTGKLEYLVGCYSDKSDKYRLINSKPIQRALDAGAYTGDTLFEMCEYLPALKSVYAIEPDPKNYKKLQKNAQNAEKIEFLAQNAAVWSNDGEAELSMSANRNSTISATASYEHSSKTVKTLRIDSLDYSADYIKYDVEGAEKEALTGSMETIVKNRPVLCVSIYHRSRDIFSLALMLLDKYPFYRAYIRRTLCVPAWEAELILLPESKL